MKTNYDPTQPLHPSLSSKRSHPPPHCPTRRVWKYWFRLIMMIFWIIGCQIRFGSKHWRRCWDTWILIFISVPQPHRLGSTSIFLIINSLRQTHYHQPIDPFTLNLQLTRSLMIGQMNRSWIASTKQWTSEWIWDLGYLSLFIDFLTLSSKSVFFFFFFWFLEYQEKELLFFS